MHPKGQVDTRDGQSHELTGYAWHSDANRTTEGSAAALAAICRSGSSRARSTILMQPPGGVGASEQYQVRKWGCQESSFFSAGDLDGSTWLPLPPRRGWRYCRQRFRQSKGVHRGPSPPRCRPTVAPRACGRERACQASPPVARVTAAHTGRSGCSADAPFHRMAMLERKTSCPPRENPLAHLRQVLAFER